MTRRGGLALLLCLGLAAGACTSPGPTTSPSSTASGSGATLTPGPGTPSPTLSPSPSPSISPTASPSPTITSTPGGELLVLRTLPYAHASAADCGLRTSECMQYVDVFAPTAGGPYPVAVMLHGRPRRPKDMEPLAMLIAARGAVVFNIDYRGVRPVVQQGWPDAPEDIACAMRYARANAAKYGGDPSTLVMVGHSYGGYLGPLVALAGDEFDGDCLHGTEVSALPTGFVGIAGNYVVVREPIWDTWYGGTPDEEPAAWQMGNFHTHIGANPTLRVRIIHERGDPIIPPNQPREFHRALIDAGYDSEMTILDGEEHFALLDPADNGRLVVPMILELLGIPE